MSKTELAMEIVSGATYEGRKDLGNVYKGHGLSVKVKF